MDKKVVEKTIKELFDILTIEGTWEVTFEEDVINVLLDTPDMGIVIGYHGETLEGLQLISSLCVSRKIGSFVRVSIEVGDYKKNRTEYLTNLALKTKERVLAEQREFPLSSLRSWERRVIHTFFQEDPEVTSESSGEGRDRVLIIKPRS